MTCAAETPSPSASRRSGRPSAMSGCAIIRASCPPPMTARVGAGWDTRASVVKRSARGVAGLEAQPLAADRGDQLRPPAVVTELAAHPPEVDVDGLRGGPEGDAPDVAHELLAGDHRAGPGDQGMHEVEFLARQQDLAVPTPRSSGRG